MSEPTNVYLTVDVECAEERVIGGRVQPAMGYDLRVWGRFANRRRELGVPLIMDELEARGFRGTFYVEALGAHTFGKEGLREVCGSLRERGHDVQLHVHPIQRAARWHSAGTAAAADNISSYPVREQAALLREGRDLLIEAGVAAADLCSYRAGNFGANNDTWSAMTEVSLTLSSNYNPGYFDKHCSMRSDAATADLFHSGTGNVWELPVSNLVQPNGSLRHLQLMAVSLEEMIAALRQSRAMGIDHVTLVTHSFEFFHLDSVTERRAHVNYINLHRLRGLMSFLHANADEFRLETVAALARRLGQGPIAATVRVRDYPREKRRHYYRRLVEQGIKRVGARIALP